MVQHQQAAVSFQPVPVPVPHLKSESASLSLPLVDARPGTYQQFLPELAESARLLPLIETLGWDHPASIALLATYQALQACRTEIEKLTSTTSAVVEPQRPAIWMDAYWHDE